MIVWRGVLSFVYLLSYVAGVVVGIVGRGVTQLLLCAASGYKAGRDYVYSNASARRGTPR